jgi:hypothetical protein
VSDVSLTGPKAIVMLYRHQRRWKSVSPKEIALGKPASDYYCDRREHATPEAYTPFDCVAAREDVMAESHTESRGDSESARINTTRQ